MRQDDPIFFTPEPKPWDRRMWKGGGGAQTTTSTTMNYSPEEAARRTKVMDIADAIYQATSGSITNSPYPGAKPIASDPLTTEGQEYALAQARGALPQLNTQMQDALGFGLKGVLDVNNNPYLQQAVASAIRPATQAFTDAGGALSNIRSSSLDAGQYGGTRQGLAEGIAAGRFGEAILGKSAEMYSDAYNKGLDTFSRTMALAPEAAKLSLLPGQVLESVGLSREGVAAENEAYAAASRDWDLTKGWRALQPYADIVFGAGSSQSTTTNTGPSTRRNPALGALGGAASGAAMGSAFGPWGTAIGAVAGGLFGAFS